VYASFAKDLKYLVAKFDEKGCRKIAGLGKTVTLCRVLFYQLALLTCVYYLLLDVVVNDVITEKSVVSGITFAGNLQSWGFSQISYPIIIGLKLVVCKHLWCLLPKYRISVASIVSLLCLSLKYRISVASIVSLS
jgi:hypothetical protein